MPATIIAVEEDNQGNVKRVQLDNLKWFAVPPEIQVPQADLLKLPFRRENGVLIFSGSVVRKKSPKNPAREDAPAAFDGTVTEEPTP